MVLPFRPSIALVLLLTCLLFLSIESTNNETETSDTCDASSSSTVKEHGRQGSYDLSSVTPSTKEATNPTLSNDDNTANRSDPQPQCSLYFAPSTIPGAGWGIYTAKDLQDGDLVGNPLDIIVPIFDTTKTIPYRGQQRFLPWLGYIWPEEPYAFHPSDSKAFPLIQPGQFKVDEGLSSASEFVKFYYPDDDPAAPPIDLGSLDRQARAAYLHEGRRMNAFTPGLASQANSHDYWDNIIFRPVEDTEDIHFQIYDDPLVNDEGRTGPRSRYHHGGLVTNQFVPSGSELFLYYGEEYHEMLEEKRTTNSEYETLDDFKKYMDFSTISTEADKRNLLNLTSMKLRDDPDADFDLREDNLGATEIKTKTHYEKIEPPKEMPGRSLDWLATNGVCIDNLIPKESAIPGAGKGAFAKNSFAEGEVISHAPLLHLKRDDLVIYGEPTEKGDPNKKQSAYMLDFDNVVGQELLLNYCFGHPESELLLVPYSPVVNYINHDGDNPNAMIRWTEQSKTYLNMHPIDVLEQHGGTLSIKYVALREIAEGEEITIDYGSTWAQAWQEFNKNKDKQNKDFRHEIGVPDGFYPQKWLNTSVKYELAPHGDLQPGELKQVVWKHNGKPFTKFAHHLGLPKGFSQRMLEYTKDIGILPLFDNLLKTKELKSDKWFAFNATSNSTGVSKGEWFAQRYKSSAWHFNMHYIAAWNEAARREFIGQIGRAGFDEVMNGIGTYFGLDTITCFHLSYMSVSECDSSFTHTDVYATGEVAYNIIWPIMLVDGSKPELNLQADDANTVIAVKYEYDTAVLMGDWGYHFTSPIEGYKGDEKRVVVGMYCGQIDENNSKMFAHLYDGEDPAPFFGQFDPPFEYHWSKGNKEEHRMSRL